MQKTEKEISERKQSKSVKNKMTIETLKGFIFSLFLQILAKLLLFILESKELENLLNILIKKLIDLIS